MNGLVMKDWDWRAPKIDMSSWGLLLLKQGAKGKQWIDDDDTNTIVS